MAISKVTTSNTNTINKVVVTDTDAIRVITVGTQGLSGAATLLGRSVEAETVGSSDDGVVSYVAHGMLLNICGYELSEFHHAVRVAPFVVVPDHDFDHSLVGDAGA